MFFQYYICKFPLFSTKYMIIINKQHYKIKNEDKTYTNIK